MCRTLILTQYNEKVKSIFEITTAFNPFKEAVTTKKAPPRIEAVLNYLFKPDLKINREDRY